MTATEKTLRETALEISDKRVSNMCKKIEESFERRDQFEGANAIISTSSYATNRDKMLANKVAVSRFMLALGVEPSAVIERKVSQNAMFNAKALKKIVELAQFVVTDSRKVEKVMTAFVMCALHFDKSGDAIGNTVNKSFLSNVDFSQIVADSDLADYLADYQHAYISGGKDTQSSQARNVLDVLGLGEIVTCDNRYRGGIRIERDHAFFAQFESAFLKVKVTA